MRSTAVIVSLLALLVTLTVMPKLMPVMTQMLSDKGQEQGGQGIAWQNDNTQLSDALERGKEVRLLFRIYFILESLSRHCSVVKSSLHLCIIKIIDRGFFILLLRWALLYCPIVSHCRIVELFCIVTLSKHLLPMYFPFVSHFCIVSYCCIV